MNWISEDQLVLTNAIDMIRKNRGLSIIKRTKSEYKRVEEKNMEQAKNLINLA